jgi:signal transduction histidine kinase
MQDWYQMPALFLTALLLPAFGHLYWRTRDTRNLLWFLAFLCAVLRMLLVYPGNKMDFFEGTPAWIAATGQALAMLYSGLFLGSLSTRWFKVGKGRILFVIPFTLPLITYAVLSHGFFHNHKTATGVLHWVFPSLIMASCLIGIAWDRSHRILPYWSGTISCLFFAGCALWFYFASGLYWPLILAESGIDFVSAMLVLAVFRRISPGVIVSCLGFVAWSLPILLILPQMHTPMVNLVLLRIIIMAKVATALGLIMLALENELRTNQAAGERERRARREIEAYHGLTLSRRRVEDFDRQAVEICQTVVAHSRFSRAGLLLLQPNGLFRLAGAAGFEGATAKALNALATRIPVSQFLVKDTIKPAMAGSQTANLDLRPWFTPGDDLKRLHCTSLLAIPMHGRSGTEGALLLDGLRYDRTGEPLRADDLVPLETLTTRLQSVRSQTRMLEKLIDSEKFAGLGQLAGNVTQQLNNPLTVVLGYASLLEDAPRLDAREHKAVEAILSAARAMRSTLESLQRVARAPVGQLTAVSVAELLADMERLHRSEFLHRSIDFRLNVAPNLPRVLCQEQQLRQAVLHCLQFAMEAVENVESESERLVQLEAVSEATDVHIKVTHTGPGFEQPGRAFDPFTPPHAGSGETAGLGLSLCATIVRDNRGHASAMNLQPRGAAILLEFPAA